MKHLQCLFVLIESLLFYGNLEVDGMWCEANSYYGLVESIHECKFDAVDFYLDENNVVGNIDMTYAVFKRLCKYDGKLVSRNKYTVENYKCVKPRSMNDVTDVVSDYEHAMKEFNGRIPKKNPATERGYSIPILKEHFEELKNVLNMECFPKGIFNSSDILEIFERINLKKYIDIDGLSMRRLLINCWWCDFKEVDGDKNYSTVNITLL